MGFLCGDDAVIAGSRVEAGDFGQFGETALPPASGQHGDDIDGFGDQSAGDGNDGFLDELLKAAQCTDRRAGMDGADAAGMAGAPGLQKVEGFRPAHLADGDAIGAQAKRGADQIGQGDHAVLGAQRHQIGGLALQLAGVFDQHHAVGGLGDFGQQGVGQGGFAGRGAAGD